MSKLPIKEDQRISRNAGSFVRNLRVSGMEHAAIAAAAYLQGAEDEYFHHKNGMELEGLKLSIQKLQASFREEGFTGIADRINGLLDADTAERRAAR
jgi:hypothetical protein